MAFVIAGCVALCGGCGADEASARRDGDEETPEVTRALQDGSAQAEVSDDMGELEGGEGVGERDVAPEVMGEVDEVDVAPEVMGEVDEADVAPEVMGEVDAADEADVAPEVMGEVDEVDHADVAPEADSEPDTETVPDKGSPFEARSLSAAVDLTCASLGDGTVRCWKWDSEQVPGPEGVGVLGDVASVTVGRAHRCALGEAGAAWCWGDNASGQLGDGSNDEGAFPVGVSASGVDGLGFVMIEAGWYHTCGIVADTQVACWGNNAFGQLGLGDTVFRDEPARVGAGGVALSDAIDVSAGNGYTCAVRADHTAWCWGRQVGQLGVTGTVLDVPNQVRGPANQGYFTAAERISAGHNHTCAVRTDRTAWCWGNNDYGKSGSASASTFPRQVIGPEGMGFLEGVVRISAGTYHTCAVVDDGSAYCWGRNEGRLGNGRTQTSGQPVRVVGPEGDGFLGPVVEIAAGDSHTCATLADGSAWCWGAGVFIGHGAGVPNSTTPLRVLW